MRFRRAFRGGFAATLAFVSTLGCGEERATGTLAPRLLACSAAETRSTQDVVGVAGGTVQLGATAIRLPGGALAAPTLITLTIPASAYMEIEVQAEDFATFVFQQPVSITIDYSRCADAAIEGNALAVWQIDPVTKAFLERQVGTDDRATRTITFTTDHLSGYAVAF